MGRDSARPSTMTVLDVLQSTTAYFEKRKIDNPRLNAEHLLAHVLERTRMELYLEFERNLVETESGGAARASRSSIYSARWNFADTSFFVTNAQWSLGRKPRSWWSF